MRIQHNISALNAHRQLGSNQSAIGKNLEKLSSGYKINRAGDDAAGLAISEKMRSQIKGLETAQKNANDGISLVQTAEGALTEVHSMLNRMTELATQSANGTYDDKTDRANLQKELSQLKSEIDRISESTNFNGINLLDGSLAGNGTSGADLVGGKIGSFRPEVAKLSGGDASGITALAKETFIVDGTEVEVDWSKLSAEDQAALKIDHTTSSTTEAATKKAASIMEKAINQAIDKKNADTGGSVNHISLKADGAGKFEMKSGLEGSGAASIKVKGDLTDSNSVAGTVLSLTGGATANAVTNVGTTGKATEQLSFDPANANGKFNMTIDGEAIEVELTTLTTTDKGAKIATELESAINAALTKYDAAKGHATGSDAALKDKVKVSFNNQGQIEFSNTSGKKIGFEDKDGGESAKTLGISSEGKAISGGGLSLQIGDTAESFNKLTVAVGNMNSDSLGIANVDIGNQLGAEKAIEKIKSAINSVSSTRGDLGAIQNRLEHTINNLGVTTENMTAAESRIRDVDMAKEMMEFTKNNILSQAATSMLAQANQLPQGVLQLLQ